jgi:2-polyprenyl-6-methoxyphenol hydroxylase-like FAD-dependent oxidoreductase
VDTDVLVVGAGPVGLFLANECARRKLRYRIIETRAAQSEHSKALGVMPRTLEIFDMAGVAEPFLEIANRVTGVALVSHGRALARMHFAPADSPYRFVAMVPQNETERLLAQELHRKGGAVEYQTTFASAVQHADHVAVMLDQRGAQQELTARYVVGCDGAHSAIRRLLGLSFAGAAYDASFMLADIDTNATLPGDEMQLCPSELGPVAVFPMSATRRRIVATVQRTEEGAPTLPMVQQVLAERGPPGLQAQGLHWSSYFRVHHRHVETLRLGRIFVAGDAAHIHSPIGGQGMNTGLHDVWNLAWKLELAVRGRSGGQLLDSYTAERLPVIKSVIDMTHFMTQVMTTPSKLAQAVRDTVLPMVSRLAPFQHTFVQRLSQLGISYAGSPIVEGAGERYFDDSIRGGNGISNRFLLLLAYDADSPTREALSGLCGSCHETVELRSVHHQGIALVRPDGYVAYRAAHLHGSGTVERVRAVLERQIS